MKNDEMDLIILDIKYLIDADLRQRDKDNTKIACYNLLNFSYSKRLLNKNPFDSQGNLALDTVIKESDLTDLGKIIFEDLTDKWFIYTDNEAGNIDRKNNIKMLEKYFNKLTNNG